MSLLFDFSPPCVFIKCVLSLPSWDDAKLHWLHLFTFSPLCVLYMYVIVASWLLPQDTLKLFQLFGQNPDIAFLNWLLWNILQNTAGKSKPRHCILLRIRIRSRTLWPAGQWPSGRPTALQEKTTCCSAGFKSLEENHTSAPGNSFRLNKSSKLFHDFLKPDKDSRGFLWVFWYQC